MSTRIKLLLAGSILGILALTTPRPAEAVCHVDPSLVGSEEECEALCYSGGCYSYYYDQAGGCFCS